jgi:hypothetical protein
MKIYTPIDLQSSHASIFLAGPTPRDPSVKSWRYEAYDILKNHEDSKDWEELEIYSPEPVDTETDYYDYQIKWENAYLKQATCILFWIPRELDTLPGFTTNIEFGEWMKSGKIVVGFPKDAPKTKYIHEKCKLYGIPVAHTLKETLELALEYASDSLEGMKDLLDE